MLSCLLFLHYFRGEILDLTLGAQDLDPPKKPTNQVPWSDWERHVWSVFDQGNGNLYRGQKNGGTPPWFFAMDDMWTLFDLIRSFWFFCSHHLVSILFRKEYLLHPSSDFFQMGRNCRNQSLIIIIFLQFWSEHHHLKQKSGWIGGDPR